MPSLSFDPVAHAYDATRGYPDAIAIQIARALEGAPHATSQTSFLEVGIGTGRIAFPLASLGHIYTGVDISEKMVGQLEVKLQANGWGKYELIWGALPDEDSMSTHVVRRFTHTGKHASLRLAISDMTRLPFRSASFDVGIAVHVFHLVDGWQQAVNEVLRVLRPGGVLLHCWDEHGKSSIQEIGEKWQVILQSLGGETKRPGAASQQVVTEFLQAQKLSTQKWCALSWEETITPRQVVQNITQRLWSSSWALPDDIFAISASRLWEWANNYYGASIDTPHKQVRRFIISKTRVESCK